MNYFLREEAREYALGTVWRRRAEVLLVDPRGRLVVGANERDDLDPKPADVNAYNIPGGGVGKSEDPEAAAVRETFEELGLRCLPTGPDEGRKVHKADLLGVKRYAYPHIYGEDPSRLSSGHRAWLLKNDLRGMEIHTFVGWTDGQREEGDTGGPKDDHYRPVRLTPAEFRRWLRLRLSKDDPEEWQQRRDKDLLNYLDKVEEAVGRRAEEMGEGAT